MPFSFWYVDQGWFVIKFSMYTSQRFPSQLQYITTLPCESQNNKNLLILMASLIINMFLRTLCICLTVIRLLTLIDWLTFWSLLDDSRINNWTLLHHGDFLTMIIFAQSSFFLCYTSYVLLLMMMMMIAAIFFMAG